jgi:tetratricopeptide (TPR) repeat protein
MTARFSLWTTFGIGAAIVLVQPQFAAAKSAVEIGETAQAITVLITEPNGVGSGVILQQQGDIYTVLTAAHVVKNKASFKITTADDLVYQAIAIDPKNASSYSNRAVLKYQKLNDTPGALADFNQAIVINPKNASAYYNRGDLFYSIGDRAKAIDDFGQVVQLDRTGDIGLVAQGVILTQQGAYPQAIDLFAKAAKLSPESGDIYKYRGEAFKQQGNRAAAISDWRKAAQTYQQDGMSADSKMVLGWLKSLGAGE